MLLSFEALNHVEEHVGRLCTSHTKASVKHQEWNARDAHLDSPVHVGSDVRSIRAGAERLAQSIAIQYDVASQIK